MNITALVRCSCIVLVLLHASVLRAQLSWDLSSSAGIQVTGDATWDTTTTNWNNGTSNVAWNNTTNATTTAVFGVASSPTATTGGTITVSGTINLGGMKFLPFSGLPSPFSFTFSGSGTLAFANDAVIELGDSVSSGSTGNQFVNLSTAVTGNNITIQRATGASSGSFQYLRFSGTNTGLTGTLTIKATSTTIANFILTSSAAAQSALSRVVIESGSVYAINGTSSNYAVPITLGGTGQGNGAIRIDASSITISGAMTLTSTALLNSNSGVTATIVSGAIGETGGSQGLQRSAVLNSSTMTFTAASNFTGTTTLGRSGGVGAFTILDFTAAGAPTTDIFYNGVTAGGLSFVGSSNAATFLNITGKASTANVQHFGAVTTAAGTLGVVTLTSGAGGSMDLSLGTITRTSTGLLSFIAPASGSITTTSTGFLGPWVTYKDASGTTSWAQVSGGAMAGGYVGDLAYGSGKAISAVSGYASTKNLTVSNASGGNVTVTGATTDISTVTMSDPWLARTITLGSNILRLGATGGIQLAAGAQNLTISGGTLTAGGASNTAGQVILTNNSTTSVLQVDANILANGSGATTLIVNGVSGSKTVLTGTNVLGGGALIASGALELRSSGALGTTGTVSVLDGAALQLSGGITLARTLSVGGTGVASDGVIRNLSGNNTITGVVTTTQPVLIQSDAGTLTFFNTNTTTNSISVGSGFALTFAGAGDIVVNSRINSTTQTITKSGTGRLTLGGDNSVITGTIAVTAGILRVTNVNALGTTAGSTTITAGASLELAYASDTVLAEPITFDGAGYNSTGAIRNVSGNNTLSGILSIGTTALTTITADSGTTLTISGTLRSGATAAGTRTVTLGGAGTINITGAITNGTTPATYMTGIAKADSGTVNLRVASTFAPASTSASTLATILATIRGGVLNFDFANASATSNLIVSSNNVSLNGGTLQMTGKDGTTNLQEVISTTLSAGRSPLVVTSGVGGTMNVALGTIIRASASGSATNITLPASGSITTTTLNTNGILNGGLVVGGTSWATSAATQTTSVAWVNASDTISIGSLANGTQVAFTGTAPGGLTAGVTYYVMNSTASSFQVSLTDGGTALALSNDGSAGQMNTAGAITGLASYSSTFTTNANVDLAAGATTQGAATINSLRFNAVSGSTLTLSGNITNSSGGLLVTSAVTGDVLIQSDSGTARTITNSSSDFNIYNYGTGNLTLASTVTVTGTAFTTSGPGLITFAGIASTSATQVRVTEGTLSIVGSNRFTGATDPTFTIGSVGVAARLIFGNGAITGAESFTAINVLGTTSSLVGGGSALYTISMQNTGVNDWRSLMIGGTGTNENNLSLEAFSAGTIQLGSANTYAGRTNLGRSTFEVSVLANAGTASSLGTGSLVSTIDMNDTNSVNATVSTLRYVGTADAVTDRAIRMYTDGQSMPSLTGVLENNGTGSVKFTSAFTAAGNTTLARTFRLSGTNTGANEIVSMTDGPGSVVTLDKAGAGRWTLTGNSTYTGGTTVSAGTLQLGNGGTAGMVGSGDVAISSGATLVTNRSDSFSINNNITGAGSLVVSNASGGSTTLTSSANTYSGGTTVSSGTLMFTNVSGSATGSGTVTVAASATLAGTGSIAPAVGNPVLVQGTLSIGQTSGTAADVAITTSGAGTLFMDTTSVLLMDLISGAGSGTLNAASAADMLLIGGTMTLNSGSTLRVQNLNGLSGWTAGDAWKLIDWNTLSGSAAGTFTTLDLPTLGSGLQWDTSSLYSTGVVSVVAAVPEPARLLLLPLGAFAIFMRRRRF